MSELNLHIRLANVEDIELILSFISQKAEFDQCLNVLETNALEATTDKLKETLFCNPTLARLLFAEVEGIAVGFALFFYTYSSFLAQPNIWLGDLFVQPQMRGKGIGTALLTHLAQLAQEKNCGRLEWTVATNNARGITFYRKLGAQILESTRLCRVDRASITKLADKQLEIISTRKDEG